MPFVTRDGCRLYWKLEGAAERPPLMLLNSIGTDMGLWDLSLPHLRPWFRLIRMDTRGHGASDAPSGDYTMEQLALDALAVLDAADVKQAAVAGVSLGGMIAMTMAVQAPERISALALICTSAAMDPALWDSRITKVRTEGIHAISDMVMDRFLSPQFAQNHRDVAQSLRQGLIETTDDGYAGAAAAIRDMAIIGRLNQIKAPTLVVAGDGDISTPFEGHGQRIADAISGARIAHLDSAHLAPIEAATELAASLRRFLLGADLADAERQLYEAGLANRRRVLGDAWVDRSLENRTAFNSDFQDLIARVAWHEIWGRPGLDERTRRLLVIAITAALGCWEEFRLHVRSALEQDAFTAGELKEVLLQTGIYAGLPAANTAFTEAAQILSEVRQS